jgi:hypothetical protein
MDKRKIRRRPFMHLHWKIDDDGGFDLIAPGLTLRNCWPELDSAPVRALAVSVERSADGGRIRYRLAIGSLEITLHRDDDSLVLSAALWGVEKAPWWVHPLVGRVDGLRRFFRHGVGFSGPSGFVDPHAEKGGVWAYESYLASGLEGSDGEGLVLGAYDHADFLQKTSLYDRQHRRGLVNRHLESDSIWLAAGFAAEHAPARDGEVHLPDLHVVGHGKMWDSLTTVARHTAGIMKARTVMPPRYHWCSWYERGPNFSFDNLMELLEGLGPRDEKTGIQAIQIDAGYCPHFGDWLTPRDIWPGGLERAFAEIQRLGYTPGIWVGPFMVGCESDLYAKHPDWVIRDLADRPIPEWTRYNGEGIPGHADPEFYALDASHPEAVEYLRGTFRTLRGWGARFFKTDFLDWGLKDSQHVLRRRPELTSVQAYREAMAAIRHEIGPESYWLGCIAPFPPMIGFADGIRVANDVGSGWSDGGVGNMLQETAADLYYNHIFWQNDPDVLYLRDHYIHHSPAEIQTVAYIDGITGGSVNTSDRIPEVSPERQALWQFLRPSTKPDTARMPYWGRSADSHRLLVFVREYPETKGFGLLVANARHESYTDVYLMADLIGLHTGCVFTWGPGGHAEDLGKKTEMTVRLEPHHSALYYISPDGKRPPEDLTLGGARD